MGIQARDATNCTMLNLSFMQFPCGERHVRLLDGPSNLLKSNHIVIFAAINNSNDIIDLLLVTDVMRHNYKNTAIELFMPYVPFARQDRRAVNGDAFSIKVFANLINSMNYEKVTILDPHSDVTTALLNNVEVLDSAAMLDTTIKSAGFNSPSDFTFVAPDAGAAKKVNKLADHFKTDVIFASKERDPVTGKLTNSVIYGEINTQKPLLVIDDICDGGGTFINLSEVIKKKCINKLYLCVSHGMFTKGKAVVEAHFDGVYAINDHTVL